MELSSQNLRSLLRVLNHLDTELETYVFILESWYKTPVHDERRLVSWVLGSYTSCNHLFLVFWFSLQNQKRFRILGYWVSDCFVLLPIFTSFYLDQFLLVYFIILSQYPHTWLFYTGCISEHAIAAKGCVSSFFFLFFLISRRRRIGAHSAVDIQGCSFTHFSLWYCAVMLFTILVVGGFVFLVPVFIYSFPCCMFWSGAEPIDGFCAIFPFYYCTKLAAYVLSVRVHFLTELANFPGARVISLSANPDLFHAFFDIGFKWS